MPKTKTNTMIGEKELVALIKKSYYCNHKGNIHNRCGTIITQLQLMLDNNEPISDELLEICLKKLFEVNYRNSKCHSIKSVEITRVLTNIYNNNKNDNRTIIKDYANKMYEYYSFDDLLIAMACNNDFSFETNLDAFIKRLKISCDNPHDTRICDVVIDYINLDNIQKYFLTTNTYFSNNISIRLQKYPANKIKLDAITILKLFLNLPYTKNIINHLVEIKLIDLDTIKQDAYKSHPKCNITFYHDRSLQYNYRGRHTNNTKYDESMIDLCNNVFHAVLMLTPHNAIDYMFKLLKYTPTQKDFKFILANNIIHFNDNIYTLDNQGNYSKNSIKDLQTMITIDLDNYLSLKIKTFCDNGYVLTKEDIIETIKNRITLLNIEECNVKLDASIMEVCEKHNFFPKYKFENMNAELLELRALCNIKDVKKIKAFLTKNKDVIPDDICMISACQFKNNSNILEMLVNRGGKINLECIKVIVKTYSLPSMFDYILTEYIKNIKH